MCGIFFQISKIPPEVLQALMRLLSQANLSQQKLSSSTGVAALSEESKKDTTKSKNKIDRMNEEQKEEVIEMQDFLPNENPTDEQIELIIGSRGPSYQCMMNSSSHNENPIHLYSSVLHLRGEEVTHQPFTDDLGNLFQYNGEIFRIQGDNEHDFDLITQNDGQQLFKIMTQLSQELHSQKISFYEYQKKFEKLFFNSLEGDFALCYFDDLNQILILTRDMFGKRSLLVGFSEEESKITVMSTSVFPSNHKVYEVPANSILFIATSEGTGVPEN